MTRVKFFKAVLPAFLLSASVGQIYAFTNFSTEISAYMGLSQGTVQFAFSLGIFFLGMGAAFFGKLVERNIKKSTLLGTILFLLGLIGTGAAIIFRSVPLLYIGYGFALGLGTGIIYISPVKTMMLWFPGHKAIAVAVPIISFGLGSTFSTMLYKGFGGLKGLHDICGVTEQGDGIANVFFLLAAIYMATMAIGAWLLKKPRETMAGGRDLPPNVMNELEYGDFLRDRFFLHSWLFMFLNISAGLCLIPLAKQMMTNEGVWYSAAGITFIVGLCGIFNGGGRFVFAWCSDHLRNRINIMLIISLVSVVAMAVGLMPKNIGGTLLVINACYGAGFSVIPAILADHYGMGDISKIHGAVLSAWGVAGLVGNQAALFVQKNFGGQEAVIVMLIVVYAVNFMNIVGMKNHTKRRLENR